MILVVHVIHVHSLAEPREVVIPHACPTILLIESIPDNLANP